MNPETLEKVPRSKGQGPTILWTLDPRHKTHEPRSRSFSRSDERSILRSIHHSHSVLPSVPRVVMEVTLPPLPILSPPSSTSPVVPAAPAPAVDAVLRVKRSPTPHRTRYRRHIAWASAPREGKDQSDDALRRVTNAERMKSRTADQQKAMQQRQQDLLFSAYRRRYGLDSASAPASTGTGTKDATSTLVAETDPAIVAAVAMSAAATQPT